MPPPDQRPSRLPVLLRVVLAGLIVVVLGLDTPSRIARNQLRSLPDLDFAQEVTALRLAGNTSAADRLSQSVLSWTKGPQREALLLEQRTLADARGGILSKSLDALRGMVTGSGNSSQAVLGAAAGDLLVAGDLRDLVMQTGKVLMGDEADPVVVELSRAGVLTTLVPPIDVVPALLKGARKQGAMSDSFAAYLLGILASNDAPALARLAWDCKKVLVGAGPGGFAGVLVHAQNGSELSRLAAFAEDHDQGAIALVLMGGRGAKLVLACPDAGAGKIAGERAIMEAARKGPAGAAMVSVSPGNRALRAHPLGKLAAPLWHNWLGARAFGALHAVLLMLDSVAWVLLPAGVASMVLDYGAMRSRR